MLLPFYLSDRVACAEDREAALRRLRDGCRPQLPAGTVVLEARCRPYGAPQEPQASRSFLRLNERTRVVALTPNLITLEVDTHVPSILVTAFPDATRNWSGVVDGEPAPLVRVDGGLLGLHVPEGRHRVGVRYFSRRIVMGYRVALATAVALAALGLVRLAGACAPRGPARTALGLGLLTALLAVSLPAYARWERGFQANARREVLLSNGYAAILAKQMARWGATPGGNGGALSPPVPSVLSRKDLWPTLGSAVTRGWPATNEVRRSGPRPRASYRGSRNPRGLR
jgi:hypothetical protein